MLIDCDTCTVRGHGCDDCVVTVLLGAPPGWRGSDPTVVPLTRRRPAAGTGPVVSAPAAAAAGDAPGRAAADGDMGRVDAPAADPWSVVELDEVEQEAVRALAEFGLVPPLRHQDASIRGSRHVS
ncbi:hypothetical protein [Modestobacter sp. SSW1-42]|uniref:hypothetical protein n=1 Tax=Modestobacter sp. SSW1-42 TaxID=596372 RepID=UPI0039878266